MRKIAQSRKVNFVECLEARVRGILNCFKPTNRFPFFFRHAHMQTKVQHCTFTHVKNIKSRRQKRWPSEPPLMRVKTSINVD